MRELLNLQQQCLNLIESHLECSQSCALNHYCTKVGCTTGDCSRCLNQIQYGNPNFTYSCTKITYQYVLRFFNRFASEICYAMCRFKYNNLDRINVVSLGCGPGSEVFGIIKAFRELGVDTKLCYAGYDMLNVWEPIQAYCKDSLIDTQHAIEFYTTNLFADFRDFDNGIINLLLLNYLLSHAAKFYTYQGKNQFIDDIVDFILTNNVRNILFNDINYYGYFNKLDSGVQMIKLMMSKLKLKGVKFSVGYVCFPNDSMRGDEKWIFHSKNDLLLQKHPNNPYMKNVGYCNSKQIFILIK